MPNNTTRAGAALVAALAVAVAPTAARADDIGGVRKKPPEFERTSAKGLYALERCMIDVDTIGKPWVYRQPDMPERVMLVWESSDFGAATVLEMNGVAETHVRFWGRDKAWRKVQPCFD